MPYGFDKSTDGIFDDNLNVLTFNINGSTILLLHTEISLKYLQKNFPNQVFNIVRLEADVFPYVSDFYYDVTGYMTGTETSNLTKGDY